jgi:SAM-dependent methyltransferase
MKHGWFEIPGIQTGPRTLREQMMGLEPLLKIVRGKSVLDLGTAEGLIAAQLAANGASPVHAVDCNQQILDMARSVNKKLAIRFEWCDLNHGLPKWLMPQYDVVLALAIIHKMTDPVRAAVNYAQRTRELLVIRLPMGSKGSFKTKHNAADCDLNALLPEYGLMLEQVRPGPRGELVQYWRR